MINISNVTVVGGGVLGTQIAFHVAYKGFKVSLYDSNPEVFVSISEQLLRLQNLYKDHFTTSDLELEQALSNISFYDNLSDAVIDADLVIESVPENLEIKKDLFEKLGQLAPAKTIFATNSSTMLPSSLMGFTGRADRFLALHFANLIYRANVAEVMKCLKTDPEVFDSVVNFADRIGMYPVVLRKEQAGYVLNTLLMPLLSAASELLTKGVADIETIDTTWRIATNSPVGPFQIYDLVGLNTVYNIAKNNTDIKSKLFAHFLKENYINKGKLGYLSGEGFYKYPEIR